MQPGQLGNGKMNPDPNSGPDTRTTILPFARREVSAAVRTDVTGWGADLDPRVRPASKREAIPPTETGAHWVEPEPQPREVTVFHSIERPGLTHVFGSTVPPRGLSGFIRSFAYGFGEAKIQRWLLLLLADRVNVVEGVAQDLAKGHVPNVFAEMGLKAEFKFNRAATYRKIAVAGGFLGAAALVYTLSKRRKD